MFTCIKDYYRQPLKMLCCIWNWLHDLWLVLKPCRFSLISLIVGFVFFGLAAQGVDILRAMTETASIFHFILFYVCIWLWTLSIWYWARHMLNFKRVYDAATATDNKHRSRVFINEVPRVLGALGFISIWFAFKKTSADYANISTTNFAIEPAVFSWIYLISAVLFYAFAKSRRWLFGKLFRLPQIDAMHTSLSVKFDDLSTTAKRFAQLILVITLVAFIWTTLAPVSAGKLGTANILLLAAANWVFIGTALVFYGDKYRVPVFILLLVWAFIISAWNDNHVMRSGDKLAKDNADRLAIQDHFQQWLDSRLPAWQLAHPGKPFPVFLVAAEGGGIRAAYWTATLLGAMQDANPQFANHVYAMSGVSGGSLGIATFAALVKAGNHNAKVDSICKRDNTFSYQQCAHAFLKNDFLAPVAGRMLYGDLLQRFLPVPFSAFDRATALELAWQGAWHKLTNTDYFNEEFLSLYQPDNGKATVPALFFNTTWVEKGNRVLSSSVLQDNHFTAVNDLYAITGKQIRLSTAVHNSARFSYVSPAGTVINKQDKVWGHLVDGGYFENSGTTTLLEVYNAIKDKTGDKWSQLRPVVMMITNDPAQDDEGIKDPNPYANEVRSPIDGLLNTRSGRGTYARGVMRKTVNNGGLFKEFGLQHVDGPVPLGWMLSDAAMTTMKKRLACYLKELPENDPLNMQAGQACNTVK